MTFSGLRERQILSPTPYWASLGSKFQTETALKIPRNVLILQYVYEKYKGFIIADSWHSICSHPARQLGMGVGNQAQSAMHSR
jgi:hypothetical protein